MSQHHLAIFGEYGAGKSSLCHKLAHDLALAYLRSPNSNRIPIILNLRVFIGKFDMEAYITSFLDRECRVSNPKFDLFKAMNDAGIFLLIFDGFDEMAIKVDADTLESNLIEIEKLALSPNTKILLTSRPEHFISTEEEKQAISPSLSIFKNREAEYKPLKILPWNEKQVDFFLKKRVPLVKEAKKSWTYYRNRIREIRSLTDLSQRPVLLDMIVKTLPRLIETNTVINLPNLYKTYLIGEIKRQKVLKKRTLLLTDDDRLLLLQQLAVDFYSNSIPAITYTEALNRIEGRINPPKHELEAHTREFLTNSFLVRSGDAYIFSHKSIMEYLVAAQFIEEIRSNKPNAFARVRMQPVILDFLKEFDPDINTLWDWIYLTRKNKGEDLVYLGGNAATLLCALSNKMLVGKDLSKTNLTEADLSRANLAGTNLKGTILKNARLFDAQFLKEDIDPADLSGCWIAYHLDYRDMPPRTTPITQAMGKLKRESPNLFANSKRADFWRGHIRSLDKDNFLVTLDTQVRNGDSIEIIKAELSKELSVKVSVYADEYEHLDFI